MDGAMDLDYPGSQTSGGFAFHDVTELFKDAAADLRAEEMLFMDGFTLQDAMSAFEIGEPRLDSGLVIENERRAPFSPLTPMLPEEICWIIDRSCAYEVEWHKGNFLQHTVYNLIYVHHLNEIEPEFMPSPPPNDGSPPIELVTMVLQPAVLGLLKCCDTAWRELSKGGVQDGEDWQSDKCEVSLLEGIPVKFILSKMDSAIAWLEQTNRVSNHWKVALASRILLRKNILQIMNTDICKNKSEFQFLISEARKQLRIVELHPPPEFGPESHAQLAFDPNISRRLNTFVPTRIIPVPSRNETFKTISEYLDGFYEVSLLAHTENLLTWEIVGNLRLWLPNPPLRLAHIRSLTQTTFYDGLLILDKFSFAWLLERFFRETIGVSYNFVLKSINEAWTSSGSSHAPLLQKFERTMYKLITPHIRALWYNPPRRRRHFMKALFDWHFVYDILCEISNETDFPDRPSSNLLAQLPKVALIWRLSCIREVLLSGFQLELYAVEERPFVYWYLTRVIDAQLSCFDDLLLVMPKDSNAYREMQFQFQWVTALQAICTALFTVTLPFVSLDWSRSRPNFYRRYKWAFRPEYESIATPAVAHPVLSDFIQACGDALKDERLLAPADNIRFAQDLLRGLLQDHNAGGWAGQWATDRLEFISNLNDACEGLRDLPHSSGEMEAFVADVLKWDPQEHPWLPKLSPSKNIQMTPEL